MRRWLGRVEDRSSAASESTTRRQHTIAMHRLAPGHVRACASILAIKVRTSNHKIQLPLEFTKELVESKRGTAGCTGPHNV
jgi:hypothetical protein